MMHSTGENDTVWWKATQSQTEGQKDDYQLSWEKINKQYDDI